MTLPLDELPPHFNLDVTLSGEIGSLLFIVNGIASLENTAPYRYPGGDATPWSPTAGVYNIRAVGYQSTSAEGPVCDEATLVLTVIGGDTTPTVTATPTSTPTPTATSTPVIPTATPTPTATDQCIGNRTWRDLDGDGLQDGGEPGLGGLTNYLWIDDDVDGFADRIVATTTGDSQGFYAFCGLQPGLTYIVEFGTNPQCRFTLADQGGNEGIDSDPDPLKGLTAPIRLNRGQIDHSVDAGYVCGS
jgi:hypothetical protein